MHPMIRTGLLATLLATGPLAAQPMARGDVTVERTAGYSWYSPGGRWGDITDRRVYITGIRRSRLLWATKNFAFAYAAELVPFTMVERTQPSGETCWITLSGLVRRCRIDRSNRIAVGAGGSPLGSRFYINNSGWWRVHATGALGALMFTNHMPIREATLMNFSVEYGGGIEFGNGEGRHLTMGFKFTHFSNAGIGERNPGLDANVVYLGLTRSRPR